MVIEGLENIGKLCVKSEGAAHVWQRVGTRRFSRCHHLKWASWCRMRLFIVAVKMECKLAVWVESWFSQSKEKTSKASLVPGEQTRNVSHGADIPESSPSISDQSSVSSHNIQRIINVPSPYPRHLESLHQHCKIVTLKLKN